ARRRRFGVSLYGRERRGGDEESPPASGSRMISIGDTPACTKGRVNGLTRLRSMPRYRVKENEVQLGVGGLKGPACTLPSARARGRHAPPGQPFGAVGTLTMPV